MIIETKFRSIADIANLQMMACTVEEQVLISTQDDAVKVDARSFLGLFTVDFSKPVKVTTDSVYIIRRLEMASRAQANV